MTFNKMEEEGDQPEMGELKWSSAAQLFAIVKVDEAHEVAIKNYAHSEKKMDLVFVQAIENGDELLSVGEGSFAIAHYELALMIKPDDAYAKKKINEIKSGLFSWR